MTKPKSVARTLWTVSEDGALCSRTIRVPRVRPRPLKRRKGEHAEDCAGGHWQYPCSVARPAFYVPCRCGADAENAQVRS